MKRTLLAATMLVSVTYSSSAMAADPVNEAVSDWSGFYVGAQAGYGWGDSDWRGLDDVGGTILGLPSFTAPNQSFDFDGFVGGGQLGYQEQVSNFVIGAELAFVGTDFDDTHQPAGNGLGNDTLTGAIDWLALGTVRLGFAVDNWLPYIKGGVAAGDVQTKTVDPGPESWDESEIQWGYALGAGVDYKLTENVTLGVDYTFVDLGSMRHSGLDSNGDGPIFTRADAEASILTARINLRF